MEGKICRTETMSSVHDDHQRNWDKMGLDILVMFFTQFHVLDLILDFSRVSPSWYEACSYPSLWKHETLDLSVLGRYYRIPPTDEAWMDGRSSRTYTRILRDAFNLSCGNITKLIFNFHAHINDEHLNLVADRCPRLRKLVLPRWHSLSLEALDRCLNVWGSTLESLMVPDICFPNEDLVLIIGENCPNLKELKFMTALDSDLAISIVAFLPMVEVLSIRGTTIGNDALEILLNAMDNLRVLNIMHSMILSNPPWYDFPHTYLDDNFIISQAAKERIQIFCCHETVCSDCQGNRWVINIRWCGSNEEVWRVDEIASLSY